MSKVGPFSEAPSQSVDMSPNRPHDIFRDGDYLVVRQRWVELPAQCVVCGAGENGRMRLKIRKASRLCALFGGLGTLFYFTVPVARLHAGLCDKHRVREQRDRGRIRILLGSALACILIAIWLREPEAILMCAGTAILLVNLAIVFEIVRRKLLIAVHADRHFVWLSKVSPAVLSQFHEVDSQTESSASSEPS